MLGTSQLRQLSTVRLGLQVRLLVFATNVDECPKQNTQSSPHSECHLLFRIMSGQLFRSLLSDGIHTRSSPVEHWHGRTF